MGIQEYALKRFYFLITPNYNLNIDIDAFVRMPTIFDLIFTVPIVGFILLKEWWKKNEAHTS